MSINEIRKIIQNIPELPSMPHIVMIAFEVMKDPHTNAKKLGEIIEKDAGVTMEILKVVNSAYYGFTQEITAVAHAVTLLGFSELRNIILSCALKPMLTSTNSKIIWEHSIKTAVAAEIISKNLGRTDADECFSLGILHDVGKIIFDLYDRKKYEEVLKLVNYGADVFAAEKMIFGFDHCEAGEELARRWKLPHLITEAIKYHHNPHYSEYSNTIGIVYAANRIVMEPVSYPILTPEIMSKLDFDIEDPLILKDEINIKSLQLIEALQR